MTSDGLDQAVDLVGSSTSVTPLEMLRPPTRRRMLAEGQEGDLDPLSGGGTMSLPQVAPPAYPQQRRQASGRGRPEVKRYRTLEEMYTWHQEDIAVEGARYRVERLSPNRVYDETGRLLRVNGIIGYETKPLGSEEFAHKYGGGKYRVYLEVPYSDRENSFGAPLMVDRAFVEIEYPGTPNLESLPIVENDMYSGQQIPFSRRAAMYSQQSQHEDLSPVRAVVDLAGSVIRDTRNAPAPNPISGEALRAMQESGNVAINTIQTAAQQQVEMLRQQLQEQRIETERLRNMLMENRPKEPADNMATMVHAIAALNQSTRTSASSEELQVVRNQHKDELENLKSLHRTEIDNINRYHTQSLQDQRLSAESQMKALESRMSAAADEHLRREQMLRDEMERREREVRRDAENQMAMVKNQLEGQIRIIQENYDRERRLLEHTHKIASTSDEKLANTQLGLLQQELARVRGELEMVRQEADRLRAEKHKPFVEQLEEVKATAAILGMGEKAEAELTTGDKILNAVGPALPALASSLTGILNKGAAASQPSQPQLPQLVPNKPNGASGQGGMRQLPPPPMRRQPPRVVWRDDDGPEIVASRPAPQEPVSPLSQQYTPAKGRGGPVSPSQVSVSEEQHLPQSRHEVQEPVVAQQQPVAPVQQPRPQPVAAPAQAEGGEEDWSMFAWTGMGPDMLKPLLGELEGACVARMDPSEVGSKLASQMTPAILQAVLTMLDIDKLVQSVAASPVTKDSALATKRGQAFLRAVWADLNSRAGGGTEG